MLIINYLFGSTNSKISAISLKHANEAIQIYNNSVHIRRIVYYLCRRIV